jgi:RNA polymerase sigma-70 factor, ECF subfamily
LYGLTALSIDAMKLPARVHPRSVATSRDVPVVATPGDEELVRRFAAGDAWAREALYRKHFGPVWNTALRLLANRADAEDVVQDTFITAFDDMHALRDANALGAWLLRITVHQAHRRFRHRRMLRLLGLNRSCDDATLERLAHEGADPETCAELARVDCMLRDLPARQRVAWLLRRVEGHSLEETAAACECSLATAKRRIRAADERIRKHVDFEEGDDV